MIKYLTTLSLLTSAALMAAAPTTGDILRQVEPPKVPEKPKSLPSVGGGEYKAPLDIKDDTTICVTTFAFTGNTAFPSQTLAALVKPYENRDLGINGLKAIASTITKYYREQGYFVARAYVPAQSMENGIVEIAIIEGRYGEFELNNSSLVHTEEIRKYMNHIQKGGLVSEKSLENQMGLINTLSGAQVSTAEIYPGKEVGTSDLSISVVPTQKYTGYAVADNYGNRYTGDNRLSAGMFVNSLTGIGDLLSLNGLISNTGNLKNIRLGYERPIGYSGLKGGVSAGVTDYTLDKITNYRAFGKIYSYTAYANYPVINTRTHIRSVGVSYDHREMENSAGIPLNVEESRTSVNALTLKASENINTNVFSLPGRLSASLGVTGGRLSLKNDVAKVNDAALKSAGNYAKLNMNMIHSQYIADKTSLQTTVKAQKSFGKNFDSSEKISVGGSNGVRAYEDVELSGDQGYALSLDLIYTLPRVGALQHNASLFVDTARIWRNAAVFNTDDNIRNLNAVGMGYSLNYNAFDLKMTYAHGFGSESTPVAESEVSTNKNKFLIQGIVRF